MDQESNSKPGNRGSWRDRLGITEDSSSKAEAPSAPAKAPEKPAARGEAKVVAKPAPMAPRPGAAARAPVRSKPEPAKPAASSERPAPAPERPQAASGAKDDAFAERLRQHRAAAEEAVKKRSASSGLDKFSFAKKEVETARAESVPPKKPAAKPAPAPAPAPAKPVLSSPAPAAAAPQRPVAPAPRTTQSTQLQPVRAPGVAGVPPRPGQFTPPQSPYSQPPFGQPQQPQHPASPYRPAAPGYGQPPSGPPRAQPPQGYTPQGADPYARGGYAPPRPPAPPGAPGQGQRFAPQSNEHDLFEDNGYRPAAPLGRSSPPVGRNEPLRPDLDDPFDDQREYGGRTASDYSQAYREYDDEDYEEDEPRGWGGLIMVVFALLVVGAIAAGLIYWYTQQKSTTTGAATEVPVVNAPETPAKAQPDATANPPAAAPAQGKKLIYDRILGTGSGTEPERIVPRQETPQAPADSSGEGNLLPLPLPPPPQTQGSLTPGNAGPDPAQQTAGAATDSDQNRGAAGSEPAASAVLTPAPEPEPAPAPAALPAPETTAPVQLGSIAQPPIPRSRPRNLVASVQQAPSTQFQPVLQPTPPPAPSQQLNTPLDLQQQAANVNPPVQAPVDTQIPDPAPVPALPRTRSASRDDDPLSGFRTPLNSPNPPAQPAPQPFQQQQPAPQPFQQQAVVAPQPLPTPPPAPAPQQPITQQSLQSFSPPPASQDQAANAAPTGSGYVVQLAAYRSEQEALGQFQQLRSRHGNIIGDLPPAVQQTNLGASGTFYRLGMGPMSSKRAATELCNKLIAAGERDCLVRRR